MTRTAKKKSTGTKVYVVVRERRGETTCYTPPDRVYATEAAARADADARNAELRKVLNPFSEGDASYVAHGGEAGLKKLLEKLQLPLPKPTKMYGNSYIDWAAWWDAHYFDMTDAQRNAIWDALTKFPWYLVRETTLEG
jgi:hypothetical protein